MDYKPKFKPTSFYLNGIFVLILSLVFPTNLSAERVANMPWVRVEENIFNSQWGIEGVDTSICATNEQRILSCFEFAIYDSCLQFYTYLMLPEDIPYVFANDKVADIEIDNSLDETLNNLLKYKHILGDLVVRFNLKDTLIWRIQLGNSEETRTTEEAIYYKLIQGEKITYYIYTEGAPTIRSSKSLEGLAPLLEESLRRAEEKFPEIKTC